MLSKAEILSIAGIVFSTASTTTRIAGTDEMRRKILSVLSVRSTEYSIATKLIATMKKSKIFHHFSLFVKNARR